MSQSHSHAFQGRNNGPGIIPPLSLPAIVCEEVVNYYQQGEWGDALLFARLFQGQCVYDHTEKAWYLWQEHFWRRDEVGAIRTLVSGVLASVYLQAATDLAAQEHATEALETPDEQEQPSSGRASLIKGLAGRAFALRALKRNSHILAFASGDARLAITAEQWDTYHWLLATPDGVLDLREGYLRAGRPADCLRTVIPTHWQGLEVPAPRFERFLEELFADREPQERADLCTFLQRVLGYGITRTFL